MAALFRRAAVAVPRRGAVWQAAAPGTHVRSHFCGELPDTPGAVVRLTGWLEASRELGKSLWFGTLRDWTGSVQLRMAGRPPLPAARAHQAVLAVTGRVAALPSSAASPQRQLEVEVQSIEAFTDTVSLPYAFPLPEPADEAVKLKHRYVELRRPSLQRNLRLRARAAKAARAALDGEGFLEVETPTLFRSTPEGAAEFVVPTQQRGRFYALPQSPQQFKQLLMVGGVDRYYQVARCYRDEGGRGDRQPEFTQIDLEASFATADQVRGVVERVARRVWTDVLGAGSLGRWQHQGFPEMPYEDAVRRFGSDKPDLRIRGLELAETGMAGWPWALRLPGLGAKLSGSAEKKLMAHELQVPRTVPGGGPPLALVNVLGSSRWRAQGLPASVWDSFDRQGVEQAVRAVPGDAVLLGETREVLGRVRGAAARVLASQGLAEGVRDDDFEFLWVVDFPLLEMDEDGVVASAHHPFTAPAPPFDTLGALQACGTQADLVRTVRGQHYDLVVNGVELGGGSIRIHSEALQRWVLHHALGHPESVIDERFGHLLQALLSGAPPHGGFAFGFDRLVAVLGGCNNLRDVIAFPKSAAGNDLMTAAPAEVPADALKPYHIVVARQ